MKTNNYPDTVKNIILASVTCFVLTLAASGQSMKDVIFDEPCNVSATMTTISRDFDKSEFETEKQYIDRINKLLATTKNISNKRPLNEIVFFFRDLARYDAETQMFKFRVRGSSLVVSRLNRDSLCEVELAQRIGGSWTRDVMGPEDLPDFAMPPEKAQRIKPALVLAIYGYPVVNRDNRLTTVNFVPTRLVSFNQSTGEIYGDVKAISWQEKLEKNRPTAILP